MNRKLLTLTLLLTVATTALAQRTTDHLDRGLVAVPATSGSGNLVSWRVFGEEYYDVTYNLYCDGKQIATNLTVSNYSHTSGTASSKYQVAAVVRGIEQEKCNVVTRWNNGMLTIPVQSITGRDGTDVTANYTLNDISLGDLDGDGIVEFIVKRPCSKAADISQKNCFNVLDCYDRKGNRLWWIDLGPNMLSGADEQWDCVCYDWDGDGKAEVLLRIQDNAYIHYADGTTELIGSSSVDTRWDGIEYTSSGNEYLLYLEGATGHPYSIGPSSHPHYIDYPLTRGQDSDWGSGIVGHRSTKHYFGAPFLDGRHASIFLGRGCYTMHKFAAYDVDPSTHKLTQRWYWENNVGGPWFGQGYHNYAIGDVDWDGRDEIIFGSMVIDDNGKGLSTTGLGHGDAQHCADLDPFRKYEEQFACNESSPAMNYRNAVTSQFYYRHKASGDDGRALCANFTNTYPGSVGRSVSTGWISSVADKEITELSGDAFISWGDLNQRIYWDGDLLDEYFDSPGTEGYGAIYKPSEAGGGRWNFPDSKCNNWSKNNPGAIADIFGDWREELVMRNGANTAILVYTTGIPTKYRIPTLWHDHQYRNAMVWQSMGYNQPPHKSYFLGELEGITIAPPPLTMTGRTEVKNNGAITTTDNHLIICETNDTKITIADGASPYMVTFNVPSWVQGTAGNNITTQQATIRYQYYTCQVAGGSLTGNTRVVKQGDGTLKLPNVDMTYTGNTDVWAGTLCFDGQLTHSPLWLNRFAELNSDGGHFKSIQADYGSIIRPGGVEKAGSITIDETLSLGFGARIVLDLYSDGFTADRINAGTLKIDKKTGTIWQKYGPQYLQPVLEIVEHMADGAATLEPGDYIIGHVDNIVGSLTSLKIEGITDLKSALATDANGNIILSLGSMRGPAEIVWSGTTSAVWDFAKTPNFYLASDADKTPEVFVKGDIVRFSDETTRTAVTLNDEVEADTINFCNESKSYILSGTGAIIGKTAFVMDGKSTVTISTESSYTGGNYLRGGTTTVSALANSTKPKGNLGGVTANATKFTMENGAKLKTTAAVTNGSPIRFIGDGGIIENAADFNQEAIFSGTTLTKRGSGWLKPSVESSLRKLIVADGTVDAGAKVASNIELQGSAALTGNGFLTTPIFVADKAKAKLTTMNRQTTNLTLTGKGQLTVYCATEKGSNYYATRTPINFNLSKFEGTLVAEAVYTADGRFTLDTSNGGAGWTLNIPDGRFVQNSGKTLRMGQLTGKGSLGGYSAFRNGVTATANTWQVGNDSIDYTYEGAVTSIDNFNKMGNSKMTVKGKWDNTGSVTISAGTLLLDGGSLGSGTLTVARNTTLAGVGTLNNSTVTINGTLQPGKSATAYTGTIDLSGQNLTINSNATLKICARMCMTSRTRGCTSLSNINKLTMNGTIELTLSEYQNLSVGDSLCIFDCKLLMGTPKLKLPRQFVWDTSRIREGLLFITGIAILEDVNSDGIIDTQDVLRVYEQILSSAYDEACDVNGDGVIDTQDVLCIYEAIRKE
ncbi:MAG: autotransporter-associated beta strand repeat-containing protein [Bacteroidaceae bacterium]|nr:autotransporter-associated beta strand repeat-containing protein [Bacteroidaceae bacterium]